MKKFHSRWSTLQRLARQRKQLAELQVLRSQQQHAEAMQCYAELLERRDRDLVELGNLTASPFQTQLMLTSQHFLRQLECELSAASQAIEVASQRQLEVMLEWQQRSVQLDQNTALVQVEREQFAEESIRQEQTELDEAVQQYRRSVTGRGELQ